MTKPRSFPVLISVFLSCSMLTGAWRHVPIVLKGQSLTLSLSDDEEREPRETRAAVDHFGEVNNVEPEMVDLIFERVSNILSEARRKQRTAPNAKARNVPPPQISEPLCVKIAVAGDGGHQLCIDSNQPLEGQAVKFCEEQAAHLQRKPFEDCIQPILVTLKTQIESAAHAAKFAGPGTASRVNWSMHPDELTGRNYFVNLETGQTSWETPESLRLTDESHTRGDEKALESFASVTARDSDILLSLSTARALAAQMIQDSGSPGSVGPRGLWYARGMRDNSEDDRVSSATVQMGYGLRQVMPRLIRPSAPSPWLQAPQRDEPRGVLVTLPDGWGGQVEHWVTQQPDETFSQVRFVCDNGEMLNSFAARDSISGGDRLWGPQFLALGDDPRDCAATRGREGHQREPARKCRWEPQ